MPKITEIGGQDISRILEIQEKIQRIKGIDRV
jgi:hypothetical protein